MQGALKDKETRRQGDKGTRGQGDKRKTEIIRVFFGKALQTTPRALRRRSHQQITNNK